MLSDYDRFLIDRVANARDYELETKDRFASVLEEIFPDKPYRASVVILTKKTHKVVLACKLPEYVEFKSMSALIRHCVAVEEARKQAEIAEKQRILDSFDFLDCSKTFAPPSEHSIECGGAPSIAPMSLPTTGGDTPILCPSQRGFSILEFLQFIFTVNLIFITPVASLFFLYQFVFLGNFSSVMQLAFVFWACATLSLFSVFFWRKVVRC